LELGERSQHIALIWKYEAAKYGTDRKLNPALIRVRRAEAPGADAEEVPECA